MQKRVIICSKLESQILQEVGDLENIKPYSVKEIEKNLSYEFYLETGEKVSIQLDNLDELYEDIPLYLVLDVPQSIAIKKTDKIFNLGFAVEGETQGSKKMDVRTYMRILKTVMDVVKEILAKNPDMFLTIFEDSKIGKEGKKFSYYLEIVSKNLPADILQGPVRLIGLSMEGLIFGPKRRIQSKNRYEFRDLSGRTLRRVN